jgi:hypothetical protein
LKTKPTSTTHIYKGVTKDISTQIGLNERVEEDIPCKWNEKRAEVVELMPDIIG